LKGIG
jgi:hypothetical protein